MIENKIQLFYYLLNILFIVLYVLSYFNIINRTPLDLDVLDKVYVIFIALALIYFFNPLYKKQPNEFHKKIAFSAGILLLFTSSLSAVIKKTPIIGKIPYFNKFFTAVKIFN